VLAQEDGEDHDRQEEERRARRDRRPVEPPSPMMIGMKGGAVCASPLVSSSAKAYSFQAKIRQKIAVAAMPVVACGSTTFQNA
jgi:hypothetical protein